MAKTTKNAPKPVEPVAEVVAEIVEPVECCGKDGCEVCPYDEPVVEAAPAAPVAAVEAPVAVASAKTYIAKDGDSYASIAAKFAPTGVRKFEYAKTLTELNKGKALAEGTEVVL